MGENVQMARVRSTCSTVRVARRALEIDAAQAARRSLSRVLRAASILKIEMRKTKNDGSVLGKHLLRLAEEKCENRRSRRQLTSRLAPEWRIQLTCVAATARAWTVAGADKVNTRNTITTTAALKPSLTILKSLYIQIVAISPLSGFTSLQHN